VSKVLFLANLDITTIVLDFAAALILFGVLYYTSHYRRRGRTDDRLYFRIVVITIICAFSSTASCLVDGLQGDFFNFLKILVNDIYFVTSITTFCLIAIYYDHRSKNMKNGAASLRKPIDKKSAFIISIPALAFTALILTNHFAHFLFWLDGTYGRYKELDYYYLIYFFISAYAVMIIFICRRDKAAVVLIVLLVASRLVLDQFMNDLASAALFNAILVVFMHINEMRGAFYDEEIRAAGEKEGV